MTTRSPRKPPCTIESHDGRAHAAAVTTDADDRDPGGRSSARQRGGLRLRLAGVGGAERASDTWVSISTVITPRSSCRVTSKPASMKTRIMAPFSASTSAVNRRTPTVRRGGRQVLEQEGADTVAVEGVGHQERHLRLVAESLGGGQTHQRTPLPQTEGEDLAAVVLGQQVVDVGMAGRPAGAEEAEPQALQPDLVMQGEECVAVGQAEGPEEPTDRRPAGRRRARSVARPARPGGRVRCCR